MPIVNLEEIELDEDTKKAQGGTLLDLDKIEFDKEPTLRQAPAPSFLEKIQKKVFPQAKTTPLEIEAAETGKEPYEIRKEVFGEGVALEEELRRVAAKGTAGLSFGISDILEKIQKGEISHPETIPGTIAGTALEVAGFLQSPLKAARYMLGQKLLPTAKGVKGLMQMGVRGGAELGLASAMASIFPALSTQKNAGDALINVAESTANGAIIGFLFPQASVIPTKTLRMATGLAVMDLIRGRGEFSIDDVIEGLADGTIDKRELSNHVFGYMLDSVFLSKVPGKATQYAQLRKSYNANRIKEEYIKHLDAGGETKYAQQIASYERKGIEPDLAEIKAQEDMLNTPAGNQHLRKTLSLMATELRIKAEHKALEAEKKAERTAEKVAEKVTKEKEEALKEERPIKSVKDLEQEPALADKILAKPDIYSPEIVERAMKMKADALGFEIKPKDIPPEIMAKRVKPLKGRIERLPEELEITKPKLTEEEISARKFYRQATGKEPPEVLRDYAEAKRLVKKLAKTEEGIAKKKKIKVAEDKKTEAELGDIIGRLKAGDKTVLPELEKAAQKLGREKVADRIGNIIVEKTEGFKTLEADYKRILFKPKAEMTMDEYVDKALTETNFDSNVTKIIQEKRGKLTQIDFNTLKIIAEANYKKLQREKVIPAPKGKKAIEFIDLEESNAVLTDYVRAGKKPVDIAKERNIPLKKVSEIIDAYDAGEAIARGETYQMDKPVKVTDTQGREVTLKKGETFFASNLGMGKVKLQDGRKVTVYEGELGKLKGMITTQPISGGMVRMPRFKGDAEKVFKSITETKNLGKEPSAIQLRRLYRVLKRGIVDTTGNFKDKLDKLGDAGKRVKIDHDLIAGSNTQSSVLIEEAVTKIYRKLSPPENDLLDTYIFAKRSLEIAKNNPDFKFESGLKEQHFKDVLGQMSKAELRKIEPRAKEYWRTMDEQLKQLLDNGLITQDSYNRLTAKGEYYSPRQILDYVDPDVYYTQEGRKISVPDSGLKKLSETGSDRAIEKDTSMLLSQVIARTQRRIFRNRANQSLFDLAKGQPDNGLVTIAPVVKTTVQRGKPIYKKAPPGFEKISVMIKGQHRELLLPTEMAREWVKSDPIIPAQWAAVIQWISGAKILKPMATGFNPGFAITNLPRDIAHIWITTGEYSKHLPVAGGQMAMDIVKMLPEASGFHPIKGAEAALTGADMKSVLNATFNRKGAFRDYIMEGGGMEFLTHQGRFSKRYGGAVGKLQNVLGYFGETSEIMTRLALRQRAIKNGKSSKEATWIARNYLDFSQGGNVAKAIDNAVPYLNAAIQGTRGVFRYAKAEPEVFAYKIGQVVTAALGMYLANVLTNKETWEQISPRDKVNNFIITTPFYFKDKEGNKRYYFFKIAKDQSQRAITSIFENAMGKLIGDESMGFEQVGMALKDVTPITPAQFLPPTFEAILGAGANKDFWRDEDIWKGEKFKHLKEEYTRYTHPAFVKMGEKINYSPERLRYMLTQLTTYGNIYTALAGYSWKKIFNELSEHDKQRVTEELILNKPIVRRMIKATSPYYKYGKGLEETKLITREENYIQNRDFDKQVQKYFDEEIPREDVISYVRRIPDREDRKRLRRRFKRAVRLKDIPERKYWLNLADLPPEERAEAFHSRWKQSSTEERDAMKAMVRRVPGLRSERFDRKFRELKKGGK